MTEKQDMDDYAEKGRAISSAPTSDSSDASSGVAHADPKLRVPSTLRRLNARIEGLAGFEARGIARVPPEQRQKPSLSADLQVFLLWLSANVSLNNLGAGLLGPLVFNLGFTDAAICAVLGTFLGAWSTAYMATFGPISGNRTMVVLRFFMGYWPSKIPCALNVILMIGYATIDAIIGGQVLSAVSGGGMTVIVGIIVVSIVSWVVAVFGMALFQKYERFSWLPQIIALFILIGCAGPNFDAKSKSTATGALLASQRLSFFCLCSYIPNSWTAAAADFYVYYPEKTSRRKIFLLTQAGLWIAFSFVYLIAIGLGSGIANNASWAAANDVSTGALIVEGYAPLKGFGKVCSVIVALGVIANSIPSTYSGALGCQTLGRYGKMIPRWVWSCIIAAIELVLALAGRNSLFDIYSNFTALMGYWVEVMICIVLQEEFIFRRNKPCDWARWEDRDYLPIGWAALAAFLLGWVGAVLGMSQAWFVGPLAKLAEDADLGMWLAFGFTFISYPPMRTLELRLIGR